MRHQAMHGQAYMHDSPWFDPIGMQPAVSALEAVVTQVIATQVNLRLLNASNIAAPIALLTRHQDTELRSQAAALAGHWRDMAMEVHCHANNVLGQHAVVVAPVA